MTAGGRSQVAARFDGGDFSASDPRLHVGLRAARRGDRVGVCWPAGRRDTYEGLATGSGYRLRDRDPAPRPLAGFAASPTAP